MKKHVLLSAFLVTMTAYCFAQTTPAKTDNPPKKTATTATTAKTTTSTAKPKTTATAAKPATTTTPATPATKPATSTAPGPTKKDGTADMRYKSNKDAAKNQQTTHLKKDGTPDKRYKENKDPKKQ